MTKYHFNILLLQVILIACHLNIAYTEKWGYGDTNGPETWASNWPTCGGKSQTPVNIEENLTVPGNYSSPLLFKGYFEQRKKGYNISNEGHTVEIKFNNKAPTISGGPLKSTYVLAQMHFHWGSEHAMNGNMYGLEAHLVHYKQEYESVSKAKSQPDGLAVVGLLFGTMYYDNMELTSVINSVKKIRKEGANATMHEASMWWLRKYLDSNHYYSYQGSLTVPPCNEVVTWIVLKFPCTIGNAQLEEFRKLQGPEGPMIKTSRPIQPLYEREIYYYDIDHDKYIDMFF